MAAIGPLVRKPSIEPSVKTPAKTPFANVVQAREDTPVSSSPYMKFVLVVGFNHAIVFPDIPVITASASLVFP